MLRDNGSTKRRVRLKNVSLLSNANVMLHLVSLSAVLFENGEVILAVFEGGGAAVPVGGEKGGASHAQAKKHCWPLFVNGK